jgi:AcrR family transcriptional regulator
MKLGVQTEGRGRPLRAAPLSPPERRAAIVDAILPLVRANGLSITTRQIAEAAGVAEGTIFGVFPDKEALLREVVEVALDPGPVRAQLADIDLDLPLEQRLVIAVEVIQTHMASVWELMSAPGLRSMLGGPGRKGAATRRGPVVDLSALARLFEPDRQRLRQEPAMAAQALVGLILAGSHPALVGDTTLGSDKIISVLLEGVRA